MNHCFEICHYQQNVPQHYYLLDTLVNIIILFLRTWCWWRGFGKGRNFFVKPESEFESEAWRKKSKEYKTSWHLTPFSSAPPRYFYQRICDFCSDVDVLELRRGGSDYTSRTQGLLVDERLPTLVYRGVNVFLIPRTVNVNCTYD